jgi:hypothetical protein
MATRIRLMARSVTCKPPGKPEAACGAGACGCAADMPSAGFDSIVTMFDMLAFSFPAPSLCGFPPIRKKLE